MGDPGEAERARAQAAERARAQAAERTREEVRAALGPRRRVCPECGAEASTAQDRCPRCGARYVRHGKPPLTLRRRLALAAAVAGAAGLVALAVVALAPVFTSSKQESAARQRRATRALVRREQHRMRREQRPHRAAAPGLAARGLKPEATLRDRAALVRRVEASILADARRRVRLGELEGAVRVVHCVPFPTTPTRRRNERNPARSAGRYKCVAAPSPSRDTSGRRFFVGHPFLVRVDYTRGAYVWCKANPPAGEGSSGKPLAYVPLPAVCAGRGRRASRTSGSVTGE